MNLSDQEREVVRYWWSMAKESLASAQREFDAEAYIFAINRLYYTIFYAVSAVFMERQQTFKKHSGVRSAFHRELIRPRVIDAKWSKFYDQLFEDRQEGDYVSLMEFDQEYFKEKLGQCEDLLVALRPLVQSVDEASE